ncbi:MAG: hypothetical protein ABW171_03010, partial [Steroidobacter sp.]
MDNRNDVTEDEQATPEHAALKAKMGAGEQPAGGASSGLSAGPHNDPPSGPGIVDTFQARPVATSIPSRW